MKKLAAILTLLACAFVAQAQSSAVLMNGQATNTTIYRGTNATVVQNRLGAAGSFLTSATNLASIVTNINPVVTGTQVGVVAGGYCASAPTTNTYFFSASYDKIHWDALTNVNLLIPSGGSSYSNYTLTVGNYAYLQCANFTNAANQIVSSNYLSIHQK